LEQLQKTIATLQTAMQVLSERVQVLEEQRASAPKFTPPSTEQVADYFLQREQHASTENALAFAEKFIAHYENTGWMYGKRKMKDWKRAIISAWDTKKYVTYKPQDNGTQKIGRLSTADIQSFLNR
jgi:hypothetical protein